MDGVPLAVPPALASLTDMAVEASSAPPISPTCHIPSLGAQFRRLEKIVFLSAECPTDFQFGWLRRCCWLERRFHASRRSRLAARARPLPHPSGRKSGLSSGRVHHAT